MKIGNKYQVSGIRYQVAFIMILVSCYLLPAHAQVAKMPADTEYFYTYGGVNFDEARDIKETPDKGYIIVGTTSSFGQGNTSVYMIKTDSMGKHQWSGVQGGADNDWGYAVEMTYDNGFFVAGFSNSFSSDFYYGAYYFKTNANGNLLWQNFIDNGANSFIYGACAMPDSGFVLCGETYATASGNADAYLIRVDKNGNTLWTNHYGDSLDEVFNSVCVINNKIYAVGSNGSHTGADSLADGWIVKLDMAGNFITNTFASYGSKQQETLNGITPYNDTLFTVCGADIYIDSNATIPIVIKYDTALRVNQDITNLCGFGGDTSAGYFVQLNKIVNISYGSICAIGTASGGGSGGTGMIFIGFSIGTGYNFISYSNPSDAFIPTDGGTQNDYGYSGIYTTGGKVIGVGGTYSSQEYCVNPNMGLEDIFFVRYNSDSIHVNGVVPVYNCFADTLFLWQASIKNYTANFKASLYPNPASANAILAITSPTNDSYTAKVISVLGNEVISFKVSSNQSNTLDLSLLSEGAYFLKIQDENEQNVSVLKFIISH